MKYFKYGHDKWIREDLGEEILKSAVNFRLKQLDDAFIHWYTKYINKYCRESDSTALKK